VHSVSPSENVDPMQLYHMGGPWIGQTFYVAAEHASPTIWRKAGARLETRLPHRGEQGRPFTGSAVSLLLWAC
jgi:hypothetical protein